MTVSGQIVDIPGRRIFPGELQIVDGFIAGIQETASADAGFLIPGFVDAHVHIESSMLVPSEFARLAMQHGTVATVSDPHEIGNVLGEDGVRFMIENGKKVPLKFAFGAPSCVPATPFETAGAEIGPDAIARLLDDPEVGYLAEMMNYPGVLSGDTAVLQKIKHAHDRNLPIDGHAPLVRGDDARRYVEAGISTDHECTSYEEAAERLRLGMTILIREGSAARNYEALSPLIGEAPDRIMFCSDDKHPDDLLEGHMNRLVARAVGDGFDRFDVLQAACLNPVSHYGLRCGQMRDGDPADFIRVGDLDGFEVLETWIDGTRVARHGISHVPSVSFSTPNRFVSRHVPAEQFQIRVEGDSVRVIVAVDGSLITEERIVKPTVSNGYVECDTERDLLKIAVVNRYADVPPAVALINNFGLQIGAIASSVAHDSHNIIAVGTSDDELAKVTNLLMKNSGGIAAVTSEKELVLPLPVAGIISSEDGKTAGRAYAALDAMAKSMGSKLTAPFMTLSFMGLTVIPALKLSDKGLFDVRSFSFTPLFM